MAKNIFSLCAEYERNDGDWCLIAIRQSFFLL